MSLRHAGEWHYEYIANRQIGHEWRVADEDDDVITDFGTEEEAIELVRFHNGTRNRPDEWKY